MLLIGDIHITSRWKDRIIDTVRDYIAQFPDEQHIVFVGDYVYHFSYDRQALLALYELFVELFDQGKDVYILAGNHDWLSSSFVYAEAKTAFDLLNKKYDNKLHFITSPLLTEINDEQILFLPFMLEPHKVVTTDAWKSWHDVQLVAEIEQLLQSTRKPEQQSGEINKILLDYVAQHDKLTVIHHYYFHKTTFPGQKAQFSYRDIALSPAFLDMDNMRFISGHIHQPFVYQNYFCTGSVWSTSSLEINDVKGLYQYAQGHVAMQEVAVNPYLFIDMEAQPAAQEGLFAQEGAIRPVDAQTIRETYDDVREAVRDRMVSNTYRDIDITFLSDVVLSDITLSLKVPDIDYDKLEQYATKEVLSTVKDIKLKKQAVAMHVLLEKFDLSTKNLQSGFADWKSILKSYLQQKYGDEYDTYEQMLQELKLL